LLFKFLIEDVKKIYFAPRN